MGPSLNTGSAIIAGDHGLARPASRGAALDAHTRSCSRADLHCLAPGSAIRRRPLTVRATVTPLLTPVELEVRWPSTSAPARAVSGSSRDISSSGPVSDEPARPRERRTTRSRQYVEARGFTVLDAGRLPLYAQNIYAEGVEAAPKTIGEAPYVVFVQDSHALGLSPAGTWIRIPWTPQMANVTFMMSLRMRVPSLIKPLKVHWFESLFTGERHEFCCRSHEMRDRPIFPMYAEHRDRALGLAERPPSWWRIHGRGSSAYRNRSIPNDHAPAQREPPEHRSGLALHGRLGRASRPST